MYEHELARQVHGCLRKEAAEKLARNAAAEEAAADPVGYASRQAEAEAAEASAVLDCSALASSDGDAVAQAEAAEGRAPATHRLQR